jgi:hypothetical protein
MLLAILMEGEMTFGRKGLAVSSAAASLPAAQADQPPGEPGVEAAIAMLSQAFGVDLDFEFAYVFAPSLWADPRIGRELDAAELRPEMRGNKMPLFKDAAFADRLRRGPAADPIRQAVLAAGFGLERFDPGKRGGFDEGKTKFQREQLEKIAASPASAFAKKAAVMNLFDWSIRLMQGEFEDAMRG